MFSKLISSGRGRGRSWTPGAVSVSVVVHLFLLSGAVYASMRTPPAEEEAEEEVTFLEIEEQAPEPPPPPEPQPETTVAPPPPRGFQELIPPLVPPAEIPDLDESIPAVNLEDFSGIGVAGGVAEGVEGGTPQNLQPDSTIAYELAVLERVPRLSNTRQVQSILQRLFPRNLLDAGISGSVRVQFVVTPEGRVDPSTVKVISASHDPFRQASIDALLQFRFEPGVYRGENVRVLIEMPIAWQART